LFTVKIQPVKEVNFDRRQHNMIDTALLDYYGHNLNKLFSV